nr:hypothetical protein [Rhodoferax sp.]
MSHVLLLDSNVWSHLILGDLPMREKVAAQLAALRLKYPGAVMATSGICVAECLVAVRRLPEASVAQQFETLFQAQFAASGVVIVAVSSQVLDCAASLRANRLKLAASRGSQMAGADGGKLLLLKGLDRLGICVGNHTRRAGSNSFKPLHHVRKLRHHANQQRRLGIGFGGT